MMLLASYLRSKTLSRFSNLSSSFLQNPCHCRLLKSWGACNFMWSQSVDDRPDALKTLSSIFGARRRLSSSRKSLYDVLGITPKATQKEVKAAYFKLSKVYHPDAISEVNKDGRDTTDRFRDISEAYEILGNNESRKDYDIRYLGRDSTLEFDSQAYREFRSRGQPRTGRSSIYNYDEWTRYHYSEIFDRQARELRRRQKWAAEEEIQIEPSERTTLKIFFVLSNVLIFMAVLQFMMSHYVDTPKPSGEAKPNGDAKPSEPNN